MIFLNSDQDHGLLAAAPSMTVGVLGDVDNEGLEGLDVHRPELVPLAVQQVERLVRAEFDLEQKFVFWSEQEVLISAHWAAT